MPVSENPGREVDRAISYEQWGLEFFEEAINEERVRGAVNTIAGEAIDFGPIDAGPGGIATVTAYGVIAEAMATRLPGPRVSYRVLLPIDLTFEIDLQIERQRFDARLLVPLTLTAVALSGVRIFIEATPPHGDEVQVELKAQGLRASVVQRVVGIEDELRRFVARYVTKELDKPHVRDARTIDVTEAIRHAWTAISPRPHQDHDQGSGRLTHDRGDTFVGGVSTGEPSHS
jgi:hypothetical protein